jgi:hypothetical protein
MPMNPRLLRPTQNQHPEAAAWADRVRTNGGTVSGSTLMAVSRFCRAIDAAGIRDRFYRLNLLCGNSDASLNAVRTPLYRGTSRTGTQYGGTTDTNNNFVAGDYAETGASGGLLGNGTSKYLNTGLALSALPQVATTHLSAYRGPGSMTNRAMLGAADATDTYNIFRRGDGIHQTLLGKVTAAVDTTYTEPGVNDGGLYTGTRTGATSLALRRNNAQVAINTTSVTPAAPTSAFFVFANNASGTPQSYFSARLMAYSIGDGLTAAQADSYNTAMQAFQTALARNV